MKAQKVVQEQVELEIKSGERKPVRSAVDNIGQNSNSWGAPLVKRKQPSKYQKQISQIQLMGLDYTEAQIDSALAKSNGSIDGAIRELENNSQQEEGEIIDWSAKKKEHYYKAIMNPFDTTEDFDPFSEQNIEAQKLI